MRTKLGFENKIGSQAGAVLHRSEKFIERIKPR